MNIAKFSTSAKLAMPVKLRQQSRMAADNSKLPADERLTQAEYESSDIKLQIS